jgi:thiol-disulfide isomerase/thioredoxin
MRVLGIFVVATAMGLFGCGEESLTCGEGTHEENGVCVVDDSPPDVTPDTTSEPDTTGCTEDADCQEGESCTVSTGECTPIPVDTGCEADTDCPKGKVCTTHNGECVLYPSGPYGLKEGDVIANLQFYEPFEDRWFGLHEIYNNPYANTLILYHSAGWCPPCQKEAEHMVTYFKDHGPMLQVVGAMYESAGSQTENPFLVYSNPGDEEKSLEFMKSWRDAFDVNYTLVADPAIQTEGCTQTVCDETGANCTTQEVAPPCDNVRRYYLETGIPFSMVISVKDMKIRFKDHGYSSAQVLYNIKLWVYSPPE